MVFALPAVQQREDTPSVRRSYAKLSPVLEVPNLIQVQLDSFRWFQEEGLRDLLEELSPIQDFTGNRLELRFVEYEFRQPKCSAEECCQRDLSYSSPLYIKARLLNKEKGEIKEQEIFFGDLPLMTPKGTLIISGAERVVVNQLLRSPGVYFTTEEDPASGRELCFAKLIPNRGAWLEFETSNRDMITVKVDGKRKIPITTLLRAIGYGKDDQLLNVFEQVDTSPYHSLIKTTIEREPLVRSEAEALIDIYKRLRPGEPPNPENARLLIKNLFFNFRRYDLGKVGRYKLNKRLGAYRSLTSELREKLRAIELTEELREIQTDLEKHGENNSEEVREDLTKLGKRLEELGREAPLKNELEEVREQMEEVISGLDKRVLTREDLVEIVRHIIMVNNGEDNPDDIDHLGNRRVRTVGELIQNQFRIGLLRLERVVKERMSIIGPEAATPSTIVNTRPVVAAMREFFGGSQLSQFMDQTNPLAELTHKRRLSAMGPGGLSRERAGFEVRDVHHSHYGRICPIETPEGPNIGLIGSLATHARINEYGFIETPYRKVVREVPNIYEKLVGRTSAETVSAAEGNVLIEAGMQITSDIAQKLSCLSSRHVSVVPLVSEQIVYLSADKEEDYIIAQANSPLNQKNEFINDKIEVRKGSKYFEEVSHRIDFMDVSPKQIFSVAASLIPFLEHDDANRALMGSNMQRQAVPLLRPETPFVATGMEQEAAKYTGQVVFAQNEGDVVSVTSSQIAIRDGEKEVVYPLQKFVRTNQGTCFDQHPIVNTGDKVQRRQILADSSATDHGELALGQNVLCVFMSWEGYNYEDAIIISESLIREDKFTSIHIEKHEIEARDTKLGAEEITRDIPNVGEESLRDLDETGIIRIGAEVKPGDILVGKITPKGETELTAEEKLLRAIFGEKAREVKDGSLRVPHGEWGKVIDVRVSSRDNHDELSAGVNQLVRVWVAQKRKLSVGDKMAGRHGNKGVISRILPPEDMPFLPDGRPVDIVLNPIGVPSRMNIGQILETHLGWAAQTLGLEVLTPIFDGADDTAIEDALARAWIVQRSGAVSKSIDNKSGNGYLQWDTIKDWLSCRGFDMERIYSDAHKGEARKACLRLWLEDLGMDSQSLTDDEVEQLIQKIYQGKKEVPPIFGKIMLRDGRTGEPFDQPVTVGSIYMMKLIHLVEDKVHARSTGPYSLITQQPLGGKAQFGGQRFGEMEVWALEAYGAANILQELLTVKSDDVLGRAKAYEAILKGTDILQPGVPESFKVLVQELRSLGLAVEVLNEEEQKIAFIEESMEFPRLGIEHEFEL